VPEVPQRLLRRTWVRRTLPAGVAAVLVVAGTVVTRANASASPIDTYRTSTVTTGSVEQRLNLTGSVQRVDQVSESFAVAGTVTSVLVSVGDTVTTGQALSTINPLPLQRAVTAANATLAKAAATLESDQTTTTANSTAGTGGATNATALTPAPTTKPTIRARVTSPTVRSGSGTGQGLARAQQRVTSAQQAITTDLGRASAALTQCVPFFPSASSPPGTPPTTPPAASPTSTATPAPTPTTGGPTPTGTATAPAVPSDAAIKACVAALRTAPTQQQIQRDQQALVRSQTDLMTSVTLAITTAGTTTTSTAAVPAVAAGQSSTSRSSTSQSTTSQSLTSRSSGGLSSDGMSATSQSSGGQAGGAGQSGASRVVSDQAAVTNARDALSSAQADLTSATLKSSIAGTVGSVSLVKGTSSTGTSVVIVGTGAVAVTLNVPLASMASIHVGQKAKVSPQGTTSFAPGAVSSISLLPSTSTSTSGSSAGRATTQGAVTGQASTTSSSPVYPVVVLVPEALPALASGSRADVSLLIGTATNVLTVPNSALTPLGNGQAMALTFKKGVTTRALVKTGYVGTLSTQITSGLTAGQQVVLADLSTALPTNTTSSRRFGVGGASGGLGGAGLGGAGLGGAGLGGAGAGGAGLGGGGFPSRG